MAAEPLPISPEQHHERNAAVTSITRNLAKLHEPLWADILLDWIHRYDGLELYMWPEEDPILVVRDLLQQYVEKELLLEPSQFASDLADLRFCYLAARHDNGEGDGLRWDPFQDGSFKVWTRAKMVSVWDATEPWPTRDMIQAWLLLRFSRTRTRTPLN